MTAYQHLGPDPLADAHVADAMRAGVLTVPEGASARAAAAVMAANAVHAIAVVADDGWTILSDVDVIAAGMDDEPVGAGARHGPSLPLVAPRDRVSDAVAAMAASDVTHAPVGVPGADLPAGLLSALDIAALLAGRLPRIARLVRPSPARPALSEGHLDRVAIADVMHQGIIGVPPGATLTDVAAVLADQRIHAVTVAGIAPAGTGAKRPVWAVAGDMDLIHAAAGRQFDVSAETIAGTEPLIVDPLETVEVAAQLLIEHAITHAIVADDAGTPLGMLSTLDVMRVLAVGSTRVRGAAPPVRSDG